jgi:hypothetical protein
MSISSPLPQIAQKFREYIENHPYDFNDDRIASVMDFLYISYQESKGKDPVKISQGFMDLENYMEGISLDDNNAIFILVCSLCDMYEKRAFHDGLLLGAHLTLELQEK